MKRNQENLFDEREKKRNSHKNDLSGLRTLEHGERPKSLGHRSPREPVSGYILFRHWLRWNRCSSSARLDGKTVLITGGNTGIGKETAKELAKRGARVIIACRDVKKGLAAANEICRSVKSAEVIVKELDLSCFDSIRQFAQDIKSSEPQIHILINNAGVAGCPKSLTKDGFEMQFGVNHLGHFLLTLLLLDHLKDSVPARIINVASLAHKYGEIDFEDINLERNYNPLKAYCRSKLANVLFTHELAKRLQGTGINAYSLHPGAVHTELGRHLGTSMNPVIGFIYHSFSKLFFKTVKQGAQTSIYCAIEESLESESGYYYRDCHRTEPSAAAKDDEVAKHLWELSENFVDAHYG